MTMSNRDRIDRGLAVLGVGLVPFVEAVMSSTAPTGRDWVEVLQERETNRGGGGQRFSREDPRFLLRVITDNAKGPFRRKLSRSEEGFANELREVGNRWGHGAAFTARDTFRALDTMELLLAAVDATAQAEEIRKLSRDARQAEFTAETKRAVASAGVEGHGLKPWREVIIPHADVISGNYRGAEFAADLYYVSKSEGSREYTDPVEFFRRTYLTTGLKDLITWTAGRIGGDRNAPAVVNLQTNFGGGKTHSMLALWHLLSGTSVSLYPDELQRLLAGHDIEKLGRFARRVALVGNHIKAGTGSVKSDSMHVRTLWGELAWQLGASRGGDAEARRAYAVVADADETRTNPGSALGDLIRQYAPCLILIDEWVAYARQLYEREDLDGGAFGTQFTFAQTLTEAVKAVPGAMLVVSIPASSDKLSDEEIERGVTDIEVGGTNGREALKGLRQAIGRIADHWRPATAEESFAIVRQRLFEYADADAQADIAAVARVFTTFYARQRADFPTGVWEPSYEERIKAAYPIHPELFDRLYQDWSTLERFQRTRGVLRLMSAVIHALWRTSDPAPLIMPGGIPLGDDRVLTEITQYLEDNFKPAIDTDIDGEHSTPARIDASRPTLGQRKTTRRIARAIFLGSAATLKAAHRGIEQPSIWLGIATPGDTVGNFSTALHTLSDQATFLYSDGARYWYATQESVAKVARDFADRLRERPDVVEDEILRRLRERDQRVRGMFATVQVGPESSAEIRDEAAVRLVILRPSQTHSRGDIGSPAMVFADSAAEMRGEARRMNRNMITFLAPDIRRAEELDEAVRVFLAWQDIAGSEDRLKQRDLSYQQITQARQKFEDADDTVKLRIVGTYQWVLTPAQQEATGPITLEETKADTTRERLAERVSDRLHRDDQLRTVQGARLIRDDLDQFLARAWSAGYVQVGELWEWYCQYVYLPRLRDRSVLEAGVLDVFGILTWESDGFAVADGYDEATGQYLGLAIPHQDNPPQITNLTLLVHPERAIAQRDRELAEREAEQAAGGEAGVSGDIAGTSVAAVGDGITATSTSGAGAGTAGGTEASSPRNTRFFGVAKVSSALYMKDLTKISQEVIRHLATSDDVDLEIRLEISARNEDGYPDDKVRVVNENARTLRFDSYGFEDS